MAGYLEDLRDFIDALAAIGEIQPIDRTVDWHLEMGAIIRHCYDLEAPAPLFNSIKDTEPGFRALGATFGTSAAHDQFLARSALALGLAPSAPTPSSGRTTEVLEAPRIGRSAGQSLEI